ncbi:hypothetical protein F2Q70_00003648 [Brassica cretica]|uniref:Uncharacterized protein n=1 Tax=Brassica cretica TaxID=69181 RepID=A0A8S9IZX7_BRACR|nr:hypothetical protein F2Q70_00003648 [Brassica cretica]
MIQVTKQFQKKSSEYLALTQKKQQRIGKLGAIWNIPPPLPRTVPNNVEFWIPREGESADTPPPSFFTCYSSRLATPYRDIGSKFRPKDDSWRWLPRGPFEHREHIEESFLLLWTERAHLRRPLGQPVTINELSGSENYVEAFDMCMGGLGAMNEALMARNLEARTFRLRPKEAKKEAARLKNEVEARKAEFESVHAEGRLVPIHVSPDCEDVAPAAPREERRLTSLRIRSTLVIMGLDIHAPVFIISPNDRYMPSNTRSNKKNQLLFSSDPASMERSIRKGIRSSSIDNNTSLSLDFRQPPSTQTPVSSTDTRSPPSTEDTLSLTDIFHPTSIDTSV